MEVDGQGGQGSFLEPMESSLHHPFLAVVTHALLERHGFGRHIGHIDTPSGQTYGLGNGSAITLKAQAGPRDFLHYAGTVGFGAASTHMLFLANDGFPSFQIDEAKTGSVLEDFLSPLAKLLGRFILLGLETPELGLCLLEAIHDGLCLGPGIGATLNDKPALVPVVNSFRLHLERHGGIDAKSPADLTEHGPVDLHLMSVNGFGLCGRLHDQGFQPCRDLSGHG